MATVPADPFITQEIWDTLVERIGSLGDLVWNDHVSSDPKVRAEGTRYLLRFLAAGIEACVELDDTEAPELGLYIENRRSWGLDNPDCLYSYARLRGDAVYRIRGNRGAARHLELQVNTGHMADGDFTGWKAVSTLTGDELVTDHAGDFMLVLGGEPQEHNWMGLDDTASFLLVRQYFDDWDAEPATLTIELIDGSYPLAPLQPAVLAARIELLGQWLEVGSRCWDSISRGILGAPVGDIVPFLPPDSASGLKGQAYGMGPWHVDASTVVILELTPPECLMWGVSLCDRWWQSIDYANHESSFNSAQATLTSDGRFVAVIALEDPGVANWLDPDGTSEGTLALRYLFPDDVPTMRYRSVDIGALADELPPGTPLLGREERRARIEQRRRAIALRYRH